MAEHALRGTDSEAPCRWQTGTAELCYAVLQIEDGFGPHIEEEIYDAEVGEEAQALCKHLIVGLATLLQGCHVLMNIDEIADYYEDIAMEIEAMFDEKIK